MKYYLDCDDEHDFVVPLDKKEDFESWREKCNYRDPESLMPPDFATKVDSWNKVVFENWKEA